MLGCLVGFGISPFVGWWMPEGASSHAHGVDFLFMMILYITTFFFILTEAILVYFMWRYASAGDGKHPVSAKADFPGYMKPLTSLLSNQHRVEMAWTFIPSVILLIIAFSQVSIWADIKYETRRSHMEGTKGSLQIGVSARQFEWRMRYPSSSRFEKWLADKAGSKADMDSFGKVPQADDVYIVNEMHLWQNHQVVCWLSTRDVIHSLNLPNFRVKQDALPGKLIPVWFKTRDPNEYKSFNCKWDETKDRYIDGINPATLKEDKEFIYDIPCAELCGWGHYRMIGRVYVHKDEAEFMDWLKKTEKNNHRHEADKR